MSIDDCLAKMAAGEDLSPAECDRVAAQWLGEIYEELGVTSGKNASGRSGTRRNQVDNAAAPTDLSWQAQHDWFRAELQRHCHHPHVGVTFVGTQERYQCAVCGWVGTELVRGQSEHLASRGEGTHGA